MLQFFQFQLFICVLPARFTLLLCAINNATSSWAVSPCSEINYNFPFQNLMGKTSLLLTKARVWPWGCHYPCCKGVNLIQSYIFIRLSTGSNEHYYIWGYCQLDIWLTYIVTWSNTVLISYFQGVVICDLPLAIFPYSISLSPVLPDVV